MYNTLNVCRHFYNMCLEERKTAYDLEKRNVSKSEQEKMAIKYRKTFLQARTVLAQTLQSVTHDLDKAFQAFFRRVKAGETPGYPRFKGRTRFHSFGFPQYSYGAKIHGRRLRLFGIGRVAVRWHRPIEGIIKTVRIVLEAGQWYACFACEIEDKPILPKTDKMIGLDVGISSLITTSDGDKVQHPQFYRKSQKKLRVLQRSFSRKKKGGKNYRKALKRVQRQQKHVSNQRKDYLHKLSFYLVNRYDSIALEDLQVKNMVRNKHLSKSILDSGWSIFRQYLTYKAENAGRQISFVNPAYTSKTCSNCGSVFQDFSLSTRWVTCDCGLSLDRDHNAAVNILKRAKNGWDASVQLNVAPLSLPQGKVKRKRVVEVSRI